MIATSARLRRAQLFSSLAKTYGQLAELEEGESELEEDGLEDGGKVNDIVKAAARRALKEWGEE